MMYLTNSKCIYFYLSQFEYRSFIVFNHGAMRQRSVYVCLAAEIINNDFAMELLKLVDSTTA